MKSDGDTSIFSSYLSFGDVVFQPIARGSQQFQFAVTPDHLALFVAKLRLQFRRSLHLSFEFRRQIRNVDVKAIDDFLSTGTLRSEQVLQFERSLTFVLQRAASQ